MRLLRAFVAILALSVSAFAGAAGAADSRVLVLSAPDIARLGIKTQPLARTTYTPRVHGYGMVMDIGTLATTDAAVTSAQAAARQSQADVKRARTLFAAGGAMSRQALDAAEHQASSDQAALLLAERQEIVQFGPDAPWRGDHADASVLPQLTSGKLMLVRATFPLDAPVKNHPASITVTHLSDQIDPDGWTTKRIWVAPADATIPGRSFFALVAGSDLQSGEHVLVSSPIGATSDGFEIPSAALLLSEGKTWCYLEVSPGAFERMPVDLSRPGKTGYFVPSKFRGAVVVRGAGLLLARELGATILQPD